MSDLISRKDAIEAIANLTCFGIEEIKVQCDKSVADSEGWLGGLRDAVIEIEALPSVEPEHKKGKWNNYKDEHCCSVCQSVVIQENWDDDIRYDYCPYCGAEMRDE